MPTHRGIRSTLVYLCILSFLPESRQDNSGLKTTFSVNDSKWRIFKEIVKVTIEKCKSDCDRRPACKGVAYQRRFLVCHLLSERSEESVTKEIGVVLVTGFDRHPESNNTTGMENVATECVLFDSIYDTFGNIYDVGSVIMFSGKSNGIDLLLSCDETGQWQKKRKDMAENVQIISWHDDCSDVIGPSGIYWSFLEDEPIFCDMETENGPWMVFQRREDGSVDFYRNWANYTTGFGSVGGEFWKGLQSLAYLTHLHDYALHIDMVAFNGDKGFASYSEFRISDEEQNFRLSVAGYTGDVGDSLMNHDGFPFSTFDRDHDTSSTGSCARQYNGAWWYRRCHDSCLNGLYSNCGSKCRHGMNLNWRTWLGLDITLIRSEMKIKRK